MAYTYKQMSKFKLECIACDESGKKMNKEHVFPKWLILKTKTDKTKISWKKNINIPGLAATLPLCEECNSLFGSELESPVAHIFEELELGRGLSDYEAELLIRWLWKIDGMIWKVNNPNETYSEKYTLKERVLNPVDLVRPHLILAISIIETIDFGFVDSPMGIDSTNQIDSIFVSGVFSRVAIMVTLDCFQNLIPPNFSIYNLKDIMDKEDTNKVFFPKKGFLDCTKAVGITKMASIRLSEEHDKEMLKYLEARDTVTY